MDFQVDKPGLGIGGFIDKSAGYENPYAIDTCSKYLVDSRPKKVHSYIAGDLCDLLRILCRLSP